MPGINVGAQSTNGAKVAAALRTFSRSQLPYAKALAGTRTAFEVRKGLQGEMRRVLERPTPYTINALRVVPATKTNPVAEVLFKDYISDAAFRHYLEPNVYGGTRPVKNAERRLRQARVLPAGWFAVPGAGAKVDAYGNMNRGQIVQVLAVLQALPTAGAGQGFQGAQTKASKKRNKKIGDFFASTPSNTQKAANGGRLPWGVWERKGKKVVSILFFVPKVTYRKRLQFFEVARQITREHYEDNLLRAMSDALRTARVA